MIFFNEKKIWIIFDIENLLWKSEIGNFRLLDVERLLTYQKIFFMKKCYFSLNYATIWCERCWENLKCYLAPQLWKLVPIPNNTLHLAKNASHMTIPVHPCFVTALCYEYNGFFFLKSRYFEKTSKLETAFHLFLWISCQ